MDLSSFFSHKKQNNCSDVFEFFYFFPFIIIIIVVSSSSGSSTARMHGLNIQKFPFHIDLIEYLERTNERRRRGVNGGCWTRFWELLGSKINWTNTSSTEEVRPPKVWFLSGKKLKITIKQSTSSYAAFLEREEWTIRSRKESGFVRNVASYPRSSWKQNRIWNLISKPRTTSKWKRPLVSLLLLLSCLLAPASRRLGSLCMMKNWQKCKWTKYGLKRAEFSNFNFLLLLILVITLTHALPSLHIQLWYVLSLVAEQCVN